MALAAGAAAYVKSIASPSYAVSRLEDAALVLEYPAAWHTDGFRREKDVRVLWLSSALPTPLERPFHVFRAPFDTRWDQEVVSFTVIELPAGSAPDLRAHLMRYVETARRGWAAHLVTKVPDFGSLEVAGGLSAMTLSLPSVHEELDIGPLPGPFEKVAGLFAAAPCRQEYAVFRGKDGKVYELSYHVPGGRLAGARYRSVYRRMLGSLRAK